MLLLDDQQQRAVDSEAKTLRVIAGAGSGKTRVLASRVARRIEDASADASHILVLTFTRKAADELRRRLGSVDGADRVTSGTFHAVAYAQLRQRWLDRGNTTFAVTPNPGRIIAAVTDNLGLGGHGSSRLAVNEISWAKGRGISPEQYVDAVMDSRRRPPMSPMQLQKIYAAYEIEKKKRRVVDYDDLLLLMTDALRSDKSFAATQQWQFRHFFVDEFQDLNAAQFGLLRAWLGDRDDLFVVGDGNQAIYGWNGADSSYLRQLDAYYPALETIELSTNYRSNKGVLAAAHSLLESSATAHEESDIGSAPIVRSFESAEAEAEGIAKAIRDVHNNNFGWNEIAVLVRTNAQRSTIDQALLTRGIPFRSAGGASWLYASELRPALELLRADPSAKLAQVAPDIDALEDESDDLMRLHDAIRSSLEKNPMVLVSEFFESVEIDSKFDGPGEQNYARDGAVTVTTFHRAKGLEWSVVFLAGVEDGFVPISNADADEELRLFYVAITRAREQVHLSWSASRSIGNKSITRQPSPWLERVVKSSPAVVTPHTEFVHHAIDEGRELLHVEDAASEPARDAINKWRAARSRLTGVEPQLILSDEVISAIVELRPTSRDELSTIESFGPVRAAAIGDELLALIRQ